MYRVGEQFHTSVYSFDKRIVMIVIIFTESKHTSVILFTLLMKQRNTVIMMIFHINIIPAKSWYVMKLKQT